MNARDVVNEALEETKARRRAANANLLPAADEDEARLNAALAEAAMARQEVAAQSARIDRAIGDGQESAARLREGLDQLYDIGASLEADLRKRDDMLEARIEKIERTIANLENAVLDLDKRVTLEQKRHASGVTVDDNDIVRARTARIRVNFYDGGGNLVDWVIPGDTSGFYPHRDVLNRTHRISVEHYHG